MKDETFRTVVKCHDTLRKCISFDHIEDGRYVLKKVRQIKKLEKSMPSDIFNEINDYIEENILPIIYDKHYFDFTKTPEVGFINSKGIFEIRDENGLDKAIVLMLERTFYLGDKLDELFLRKAYIKLVEEKP